MINVPSAGPSSVPPPVPATPAIGPEQVPQRGAERANVISNTRGALSNLAEAALPLAAGAGIISIMAYGAKMMFKGEAPSRSA